MNKHTCIHILHVYTTDSSYQLQWFATLNIRYSTVYAFVCINNYTVDTWKAIQSRSFFLILIKGEKIGSISKDSQETYKVMCKRLLLLKDILNLKLKST